MTQPLAAGAFAETDRSLRVWFSSDNATFTQLAPDRRIAVVPYALQAEEARNAWSLTGNAGTRPARTIWDHRQPAARAEGQRRARPAH